MNKAILSKTTILYAEDETDVREFTGRTLSSITKKVYLAKDGQEGLDIYKQHDDIDLIITDINMPRMNGLEMCAAIKKLNKDIPIVVTSAYNDPAFLKQAIDIGVCEYSSKPIDLYLLLDAVVKSVEPIFLKKELSIVQDNLQDKIIESNKNISTILDAQNNLVLIINKKEILHSNKKFLNYFSIKTIEEFKNTYPDLLDIFEKDEEYFSSQNLRDEENWIDYILEKKDLEISVNIKNNKNKENIFTISLEEYDKIRSQYIITFQKLNPKKKKTNLLEHQRNFDSLTNLYNKNRFLELFAKELRRDIRYKNELTLLMLSLDDFAHLCNNTLKKNSNALLLGLSSILLKSLREHDILARYEENKFLILLPQTNINGAIVVAEKIRIEIENLQIEELNSVITASFGLSFYENNDDIYTFINKVTTALGSAQEKGKNRVEVY